MRRTIISLGSALFFGAFAQVLSAATDSPAIWPTINPASGLGSIAGSGNSSLSRYLNMGPITWDGAPADSYLDTDSLTLDHGNIEIISIKNFPNERLLKSIPYNSESNKINLDCTGRRFRLLDSAKYSDLFAKGVVIESNNFALQGFAKWADVAPNTLMDRILNSSCYIAEKKR